MSFFKELPDPPESEPHPRNPRMGASRVELPISVPLALMVVRNERAALVLGPIQVFSDGFEIGANVIVRHERRDRSRAFDPFSRVHGEPTERIMRLAFVFADGTSAEALRAWESDGGRVLMAQGGGGGPGRWSTSFWSWPLPPAGTIEVVCAWPVLEIAEARTSFDAAPILEAAQRVEQLWPGEGSPDGNWSTSTNYFRSSH